MRNSTEYLSKYILKDNFGKNISIQIIFNIDSNELSDGNSIPTLGNWEYIKDYLNTNRIFSSIEDDGLARLTFVSLIEGINFLSQISFASYKLPITDDNYRQKENNNFTNNDESTKPVKNYNPIEEKRNIDDDENIIKENREDAINYKPINPIAKNEIELPQEKLDDEKENGSIEKENPKEEIQNENDYSKEAEISSNFNENIEKSQIPNNNYNSKLDNDIDSIALKTSSEDISKQSFEEISERVDKIYPKGKIKIPDQYFIGYKLEKETDMTGKENWVYALNKDRKPVKLYFAKNNIGKIIASHMFINGKTGSGKTSFNQSLIHSLLYHGVNVFAFDIKTASIDYSATIINKPESKEEMIKLMNDQKYKGILPPDKNIEFVPDDIPSGALEILNPNYDSFMNKFGKKVIPLVIYNNPDESENIKYFTSINILNNNIRDKLIELSNRKEEDIEEYNSFKQEYKEGINKMLTAYIDTLIISSSQKKFVETMSYFVSTKIINYMEKTNFKLLPTNMDFSEMLHDYSMFGKDIKTDSEEARFIEYVYDNNVSKKIINFENGIDLLSILNSLIKNGSNFYLTIRTNISLLSFYVIYLYYLLSKGNKLKIEGMKEGEAYTAMFIDEAHYLDNNPLVNGVLKDAQRTDRLRNRGWIFSAQKVFQSGFNKQESIGTYIFFSGQSGDVASQKTKFSKIIPKDVITYINSHILTFTTDNDDLIVEENGEPFDRNSFAIKSIPNRAYTKDIGEYGKTKYAENIKPYLIQNQHFDEYIYIHKQRFNIPMRAVEDDEKLLISSLNDEDKYKLLKMVSDLSLQVTSIISDEHLNEKEFTSDSLQYIYKILLLIGISRELSSDVAEVIKNYIFDYKKEKNLDFMIKLNDLLVKEKQI